MNALDGTQCDLQILFPLACGLRWGHSPAATGCGHGSPFGNRHLPRRLLSPHRLPFWIWGSPLGLKPPSVCIHRYGEYEVGLYVPVQTGRRPEGYRNLGPLPHALSKLLQLIHQHGCGDLPPEAREGDLMNRFLPRWPAPHGMEPETTKPEGSQWFPSFFHDLLACHVQEDRVRLRDWHHLARLQNGDQYQADGIQLVCGVLTGCRSMPHAQMHEGTAKGLHGNVVRLIHEPHSHGRWVLFIKCMFSCS